MFGQLLTIFDVWSIVDYLSCGENIARNPLLSQATEEGP